MKILQANAGAFTNFEVLEFLRNRGAANDPTRVIVPVAPSEFKVYDYLETSAARNQTMDIIAEFMDKSRKYDLPKAEMLNIINIRPSSVAEIDPIIEQVDTRFKDDDVADLVELVTKLLPPSPNQLEAEDAENATEDGEDVSGEQQKEDTQQVSTAFVELVTT